MSRGLVKTCIATRILDTENCSNVIFYYFLLICVNLRNLWIINHNFNRSDDPLCERPKFFELTAVDASPGNSSFFECFHLDVHIVKYPGKFLSRRRAQNPAKILQQTPAEFYGR